MSSRKLVTDDNLDYLRAGSLRLVLFCIGAALYVWYLIMFQPANTFPVDLVGSAIWGPVFLGIGVGLALTFQKRSSSAAAAYWVWAVSSRSRWVRLCCSTMNISRYRSR